MLRAAIFDMDGLIVDSEPLWREAEIATFAQVGVTLTNDNCKETMGWRTNEVIRYWYEQRPWTGASLEEVENDLLERVAALIVTKGQPMPGVLQAIELCRAQGLKLALASSSPMKLIQTVLRTFALESAFDVVRSAETEAFGKPHPQVFITTAQELGVAPDKCFVLEDSFYGVVAAVAAKMKVIAVPDAEGREDERFCIATRVLPSLEALDVEVVRTL